MGLGSLWMLLSTGVLNLSMVLYHSVTSRLLGDGYGELSALSALTNVLGVVTLGASTTLVKVFAEDEAHGGDAAAKGRILGILPILAKVMVTATLILALTAPLVMGYLKLKGSIPYVLVSSMFVLNLGILAARSAVQGTQRFGYLGLSISSEGIGRVAFAAWLVGAGLGVIGAVAASVLAQFVGLVSCLVAIRAMGEPRKPRTLHLGTSVKEMGLDAAVLGLFSLLCYLDIFVIKHQVDDNSAAMYGRAALVGKSFLYLAAAFNMVLLPSVSSARAKGGSEEARHVLIKFLGAALLVDLAGLAFVWIFTDWVIQVLCGSDPKFLTLAPLVRIFSAAVIPLALSQLVLFYLLAARDYRALYFLGLAALIYALLLHGAATDSARVVHILGALSVSLLVALLGLALTGNKAPRPARPL